MRCAWDCVLCELCGLGAYYRQYRLSLKTSPACKSKIKEMTDAQRQQHNALKLMPPNLLARGWSAFIRGKQKNYRYVT